MEKVTISFMLSTKKLLLITIQRQLRIKMVDSFLKIRKINMKEVSHLAGSLVHVLKI